MQKSVCFLSIDNGMLMQMHNRLGARLNTCVCQLFVSKLTNIAVKVNLLPDL